MDIRIAPYNSKFVAALANLTVTFYCTHGSSQYGRKPRTDFVCGSWIFTLAILTALLFGSCMVVAMILNRWRKLKPCVLVGK
jgi:hypothetical protein